MNSILKVDLQRIADSDISFNDFHNKTFLVTGATGLIGSMIIKALLFCNQQKQLNISIIALVRDIKKAEKIFEDFLPNDVIKFVIGDLSNGEIEINIGINYIIHAASVTSSKYMIERPIETIKTSINGTDAILQLAKEKKSESVVYVSSMEMYGTFEKQNEIVTEDKIGLIDPLIVRSDYPESKRMCENLCVAYSSEYGIPVKIARLSQTFGAGVLPTESRVFSQFAHSVIERKDIVLHTEGLSEGNYTYLSETIEALLILLLKGTNGEAYNIANEACHMTIAEMAKMVSNEVAGKQINVLFDIPKENIYGYAKDTHMKLSSEKMRSLGWSPKIGLKEAYIRMIDYMKEEME